MTSALFHPQYGTGHPLAGGCLGIGKFVGERGDRSCWVRVCSGPLSRRSLGGRRRRFCLYMEPRYQAADDLAYRFEPVSARPSVSVRFHAPKHDEELIRGVGKALRAQRIQLPTQGRTDVLYR